MKSPVLTVCVIWLCVISLVAVIVTIADKWKAKRGKWRVPEATLLLISALGGSAAMYVTMLCIRHKTKHIKFMAGIPLIFVFQIIILVWCLLRFGVL